MPVGTQGDVIYRGASSWQFLGAGTSGYFLRTNGAGANPSWASASGGPGATATTIEVDLGSSPVFRGQFTITDAGISGTSKVLCWQAPGPYTGKGTRADEAEMQPVSIIAVSPSSGSAIVYWQTPPIHLISQVSLAGRLNTAGATFDRLVNQRTPAEMRTIRTSCVRGNIKFTYVIFA